MKELKNKIAKILVKNFIFHGIELFPNPIVNEILSLLPDYKKLRDDFGPFYFKDMNRELGLPEDTDLDAQMRKIKELKDYGSQPNKWGLVAQKTCGCNNGYVEKGPDGATYSSICRICHGASKITRTLTNDEVGEIFVKLFKHSSGVYVRAKAGVTDNKQIILPTGERVVVEEKK